MPVAPQSSLYTAEEQWNDLVGVAAAPPPEEVPPAAAPPPAGTPESYYGPPADQGGQIQQQASPTPNAPAPAPAPAPVAAAGPDMTQDTQAIQQESAPPIQGATLPAAAPISTTQVQDAGAPASYYPDESGVYSGAAVSQNADQTYNVQPFTDKYIQQPWDQLGTQPSAQPAPAIGDTVVPQRQGPTIGQGQYPDTVTGAGRGASFDETRQGTFSPGQLLIGTDPVPVGPSLGDRTGELANAAITTALGWGAAPAAAYEGETIPLGEGGVAGGTGGFRTTTGAANPVLTPRRGNVRSVGASRVPTTPAEPTSAYTQRATGREPAVIERAAPGWSNKGFDQRVKAGQDVVKAGAVAGGGILGVGTMWQEAARNQQLKEDRERQEAATRLIGGTQMPPPYASRYFEDQLPAQESNVWNPYADFAPAAAPGQPSGVAVTQRPTQGDASVAARRLLDLANSYAPGPGQVEGAVEGYGGPGADTILAAAAAADQFNPEAIKAQLVGTGTPTLDSAGRAGQYFSDLYEETTGRPLTLENIRQDLEGGGYQAKEAVGERLPTSAPTVTLPGLGGGGTPETTGGTKILMPDGTIKRASETTQEEVAGPGQRPMPGFVVKNGDIQRVSASTDTLGAINDRVFKGDLSTQTAWLSEAEFDALGYPPAMKAEMVTPTDAAGNATGPKKWLVIDQAEADKINALAPAGSSPSTAVKSPATTTVPGGGAAGGGTAGGGTAAGGTGTVDSTVAAGGSGGTTGTGTAPNYYPTTSGGGYSGGYSGGGYGGSGGGGQYYGGSGGGSYGGESWADDQIFSRFFEVLDRTNPEFAATIRDMFSRSGRGGSSGFGRSSRSMSRSRRSRKSGRTGFGSGSSRNTTNTATPGNRSSTRPGSSKKQPKTGSNDTGSTPPTPPKKTRRSGK